MIDKDAIRMLGALAQEHRLKIFRLLVQTGPQGMPSSEIASSIGASPAGTSFHLKELEHARLVSGTREGRFIRYAIDVESMRELMSFLTEDCCQGQPELCADTRPSPARAKARTRNAASCAEAACAPSPAKKRKTESAK